MSDLRQDLRYTLRRLRNGPGFAAAASFLPARRAKKVEPIIALRYE